MSLFARKHKRLADINYFKGKEKGEEYIGNKRVQDVHLFKQIDLFVKGQEDYHTYRVPALIVSKKGTILAFCEGRKYGAGDADKIDIVLRRSFDGGKTWQPMQIIVADGNMTCGNPCPVVDQNSGTIWLPFCKNLGEGDQILIMEGKAPRTVWMTSSADNGATWTEPEEITKDVKDSSWTWYATGPGHGIQLKDGTLVIPCDHVVGNNFNRQDIVHSHIIYSNNHGINWRIGGIVNEETDECTIVQTVDGFLNINSRNGSNYKGAKRRTYAWSKDNGVSFSKFGRDETLIEPGCQGSLVRFTSKSYHDRNRILFSNPASNERERLTVRVSYDECRAWPLSKLLYDGPSAYSDLTIAPDMSICCLYEQGKNNPYEKLAFAQFTIEWLTGGIDRLV